VFTTELKISILVNIIIHKWQDFDDVVGKAGRKTLLLEKKKFPREKYCGDAVCKTAIEILDEMGILQQLLDENKAKIVGTFLWYFAVSL